MHLHPILEKITFDFSKMVGVIHLSGMILENMYSFIITKNRLFDKFYMYIFISRPISWIIFKDECIISYIVKKYNNPDYELGKEPENVKDISNLFYDENLYSIFYHINNITRIISLYKVNYRTIHLPLIFFNPTMILYLLYIYDIKYKFNFRFLLFPYFQTIMCAYLYVLFCMVH
jgi:hypothetical protein